MPTIKQLADELGITKQAVRKHLLRLPPEYAQKDSKGIIQITNCAANKIKEFVRDGRKPVAGNEIVTKPVTNTEVTSEVTTVIAMLQRELESKNILIESQQQSIRELTAALENTTTSLQAAQALHAGTMQKQITGKNSEPTAPVAADEPPAAATNKRGFFARMFGRK